MDPSLTLLSFLPQSKKAVRTTNALGLSVRDIWERIIRLTFSFPLKEKYLWQKN